MEPVMTYSITGLAVEPFQPFFGLPEAELARHHIVRMKADAPVGYPCRVLLEDAKPGDSVLLLNHEYQSADTPYRGRHAIFVNDAANAPGGYCRRRGRSGRSQIAQQSESRLFARS